MRAHRGLYIVDDHSDQVRPMADHHPPDDAWPIAELLGGGEYLFLVRLEMLAPGQ
jgi:hypothetical protein